MTVEPILDSTAATLDFVWFAQLALLPPLVFGALVVHSRRPRAATRAQLATALLAATILPWCFPVTAAPGAVMLDVRADFAASVLARAPGAPVAAASGLAGWQLVWLTGIGLLLVRFAIGLFAVRRRLRATDRAPSSLARCVAALADELRVSPPAVRVATTPLGPAIYCAPRPVLVVPCTLLAELDAPGTETVLLHELAHLRRRDHWLRAIAGTACTLAWWNPLLWGLRRALHRAGEEGADAWVAQLRPAQREAYARSLLALQGTAAGATPRLALPALSRPARALAARIRALFGVPRPTSSIAGLALTAVFVWATTTVGWLAVQTTAPTTNTLDGEYAPVMGLRPWLARTWIRLEGETRDELLDTYIATLQHGATPRVRRDAADDLGNLFERGSPALPALLHALRDDPSPSVRGQAIDAIGRIGPHAIQRARPALRRALRADPAPRVRRAAEDALRRDP